MRDYLPPPERCLRLDQLLPLYDGSWNQLTGYLPHGRVFGEGIVLSPDGRTIARDVSQDLAKEFKEHWLIQYQKINPPEFLSGRTAVVAVNLGSGYGHWLLEELPRLIGLNLLGIETILAHHNQKVHEAAFKLLSFTGRIIHTRRRQHWSCEELVIPPLFADLNTPTRELAVMLNKFVESLIDHKKKGAEKIFISRSQAKRRRVIDEDRLWDKLESRGFKKLVLEQLSWSEQINHFRAARLIVAPHGAGLANLVFCQPGVKVIELLHRAYVPECYKILGSVCALDYRSVITGRHEPLGIKEKVNNLDIPVEVKRVLEECDYCRTKGLDLNELERENKDCKIK